MCNSSRRELLKEQGHGDLQYSAGSYVSLNSLILKRGFVLGGCEYQDLETIIH